MPQRYEILRKRGKGKRKKFRDWRNSMSYAHLRYFLKLVIMVLFLTKKKLPFGQLSYHGIENFIYPLEVFPFLALEPTRLIAHRKPI